jgi:hypothetical protein
VNPQESGAIECDSHVAESLPDSKRYPEYHGARETPWESGETTLQG